MVIQKLQHCVDEAKLWLSEYIGSKPSCRKKDATNEIIIVPSLKNRN
jgi:hypothetical protein